MYIDGGGEEVSFVKKAKKLIFEILVVCTNFFFAI